MKPIELGPIRFDQPIALTLLVLVPLAVLFYRSTAKARRRRALTFSAVDTLLVAARPRRFRRHLPFLAALLSAVCTILAAANPQIPGSVVSQRKTVILVVDVSRSMAATDVAPTRLAAAQEAAARFVDKIPRGYQIGLVTFSAMAMVKSVPTANRDIIRDGLSDLQVANGTATGDALILALSQFGEHTEGGVVVMLSDGRQTSGSVTMEQAGAAMKAAGVKVYSIALGTPTGQIATLNEDGSTTIDSVPPDPVQLGLLSTVTGGKTFEAVTIDQLNTIYTSVGGQLTTQAGWTPFGWALSLLALTLLVLAGILSRRFMSLV